ncbi:MAG: NAD(P)H-dependent oxidoreductase subunit E, partial [Nitrospinaceae bacterium]|nr:NAD(P)H-dependent oxidoreductase subunit E [Nitrospinaceae bacterium]
KYIIKLCYGTACFVKGAPIINEKIHDKYHIKPGETDKSKLFTLQTASCLGNCGAAPMAIIGEDTYGTIDPEKRSTYFRNTKWMTKKRLLQRR